MAPEDAQGYEIGDELEALRRLLARQGESQESKVADDVRAGQRLRLLAVGAAGTRRLRVRVRGTRRKVWISSSTGDGRILVRKVSAAAAEPPQTSSEFARLPFDAAAAAAAATAASGNGTGAGAGSPQAAHVNERYTTSLLRSNLVLRQAASVAFRQFDRDRNGQIDRRELADLCSQLSEALGLPAVDRGHLEWKLRQFDADQSGGLDEYEFHSFFRDLLQTAPLPRYEHPVAADDDAASVASSSSDMDASGSGDNEADGPNGLSMQPIVSNGFVTALIGSDLVLRREAAKLFRQFDLDENGQIDRDELHLVCKDMHEKLGLPVPSGVDLGRALGRFDNDLSGALNPDQFYGLFREYLRNARVESGLSAALSPNGARH
eukprot:TRINITY_DN11178_c4_g1_i1.p1 TRINITY_DN11178_c4_g1~~TRINITY_DN11178_c4_g1_i1.p1  ORF type:complete len:378 (+),score=92.02 TRINITY_DN11178_c4_g1_i1:81-1214(+)